ncbi:MAG: GNAT family N-acetyltransferase [Prevotella sp.]|nr:GNAT family N-acetyltransferase [Prevotella sp.]
MDEIILRALEPEDLDVLYSIENDIELWNVGYTTVPYSRYLLHDYIANSTCDIYADKQLRLLAVTMDGGDVVGIVDITDYNPQHNRAELGLVVRRQYRNMGYGSIIVKQMIEYAHQVIHLHQLYVVVDIENTPSIDLFKNNGFRLSHYLEDWLYDGEKYRKAVFLTLFL